MSGGLDKDGYHIISLTYNKKKYTCKVHRLVAEAFIPNPYNLPEVNHKNGNKLDNRVSNLEWSTTIDNTQHACINDLRQKSLDPEMVEYVCVLLSTNLYSVDEISVMSGVTKENIKKIKNKKTWVNISNKYNIDNYNPKDHKDYHKCGIRLNKNQVKNICKALENNMGSFSQIARDNNVSIQCIRRIYMR